jgi:hypothetical protein
MLGNRNYGFAAFLGFVLEDPNKARNGVIIVFACLCAACFALPRRFAVSPPRANSDHVMLIE